MKLLISPEKRAQLIDKYHPGNKQGLLKMAVVIVIGIIIISVLGFDIRAAVENPQTEANFSFLGQFIADIWNNYLAEYWAVIWNIIGPMIEFAWRTLENFDWSNASVSSEQFIQNNSPQVEQ